MKTWNVFSGCKFDCVYCWARSLITTRMKDTPKYKDCLFEPTFHRKELEKHFGKNDFVFVAPMGDIAFCPSANIDELLIRCARYYPTKFLFCTKNPATYQKWEVTDNVYLGATIETNRPYPNTISKAPQPSLRGAIMASLEDCRKFISIEPVMDFDLVAFCNMIYDIKPEIVEIGADNYGHNLPEPSAYYIDKLIEFMTLHGITVVQKQGLERLLRQELPEVSNG
jgi:hypothetical protein